MCSATVVGENYILTAAHCVYGSEATTGVTWHTDYEFYPGEDGQSLASQTPWVAANETTFSDYISDADAGGSAADSESAWVHDYALIQIAPEDGYQIGDVTGTYQPVFNGETLGDPILTDTPRKGSGRPGRDSLPVVLREHRRRLRVLHLPRRMTEDITGCQSNGGTSGGPVSKYFDGGWYVGMVNSGSTSPRATTATRRTTWGPR